MNTPFGILRMQQPDRIVPEGIITKIVVPGQKWRVKYAATEWFAIAPQPSNFSVGDSVKILAMQSAATLLVEQLDLGTKAIYPDQRTHTGRQNGHHSGGNVSDNIRTHHY